MKSRAAVAKSIGNTEITEFQLPNTKSQDGLLKIEIAGVCSTDWHYYQDKSSGVHFPLILGHECIGRIHEIGQAASNKWGIQRGDRVGVLELISCGHCEACHSGVENRFLCSNALRYGAISTNIPPSIWGGFSEFMYLDSKSVVFPIPEEIPLEIASLVVPIANGIDWVRKARPVAGPSDTIIIIGPGAHGLGCVVAAKREGYSQIIVIGLKRDARRLEVARSLGANQTIEADDEDSQSRVKDLTMGCLADTVVNVADNSPESFLASLRLARKSGTVVMAGYSHSTLNTFSPDVIIGKALTIKGVRGRDLRSMKEAIDLIQETKVPLELLCSNKISIEETDFALRTFARKIPSSDPIHVSIVP